MKNKLWYPLNLEKASGIPINSHPGAFGCARKFNFHEGVDLYGNPGDWVYAIRDGTVIDNSGFTGPSVGHPWWLDTNALLVKDDEGYYVYGEIKSDLKKGDVVKAGNKIAELTPVLPEYKKRDDIPGHSVTMLHLERWSLDYNEKDGWSAWKTRETRPKYLLDPTLELINVLTTLKRPVTLLSL